MAGWREKENLSDRHRTEHPCPGPEDQPPPMLVTSGAEAGCPAVSGTTTTATETHRQREREVGEKGQLLPAERSPRVDVEGRGRQKIVLGGNGRRPAPVRRTGGEGTAFARSPTCPPGHRSVRNEGLAARQCRKWTWGRLTAPVRSHGHVVCPCCDVQKGCPRFYVCRHAGSNHEETSDKPKTTNQDSPKASAS